MVWIFVFYTVTVVGINLLDDQFTLPQWFRITMSLAPILPAVLMVFAVIAFVRSMDEVWQRIITESSLASAIIVGLGCFTYGFLQGAMVLPDISLLWVWPALIAVQGIAMIFVKRRYQ